MNCIFLDFDGVVNNVFTKTRHPDFPRFIGVEPKLIKMVYDICEELDLKIVWSSSWRQFCDHDLEMSKVLFTKVGLDPNRLVGLTPYLRIDPRTGNDFSMYDTRAREISLYVRANKDIEKYAIIDDIETAGDCVRQNGKFFQTNEITGIDEEVINQIREFFQK